MIPEKFVTGGAALVRLPEGTLFLRGAIPGEVVRYRPYRRRGGTIFADTVAVDAPSADRVSPACPHFGRCGGCEWQFLAYGAQLEAKRAILTENFVRIGKIDHVPTIAVIPSEPWYYRHRVQFHRTAGGVGFHERGSERVVPVEICPVSAPGINRFLAEGFDQIPHRSRFTVVATGDETYAIEGDEAESELDVAGSTFAFETGAFFQANTPLFSTVVTAIAERIGSVATVYDLYAGSGVIGISVAPADARVVLVEPDRRNCDRIRKNGAGGSRFDVYNGTAEEYLRGTAGEGWSDSVAVLDPPRRGLSPTVREELLRRRPERIFYLSCDPAALARDCSTLADGYRFVRIELYDFFPQTSHIETLVELRLREKR